MKGEIEKEQGGRRRGPGAAEAEAEPAALRPPARILAGSPDLPGAAALQTA